MGSLRASTAQTSSVRLVTVGVLVATTVALAGACGGGGAAPDIARADVELDDVRASLNAQGIDCDVVAVATSETPAERQHEKLIEFGAVMPEKILDCGETGYSGAKWHSHDQMTASNQAAVASVCDAGITEVPDDLMVIAMAGRRTLVSIPHAQGVVAAALEADTGLEKLDVTLDCEATPSPS